VLRYLRLLGVQLRASMLLAMQYRLDFVIDAAMTLFWTGAAIVPLLVLFDQRKSVAGWTAPEALLVVAWFTFLKGVLDGAIQPSLQNVVDQIRKGTLDFVLLKPADAQFLVSTSRFEIFKCANLFAGLGLVVYALAKLGHVPSGAAIATTMLLLCASIAILYSMWILVVALAFRVVKVDNLTYLFASIYDAARWPASVFRGPLSFVFTFILPLAVMTTFPALAVMDRLPPHRALFAVLGAALFAWIARRVWLASIAAYTSAGG
jgi:ABC-2 type transport system permease protein